MGARIVAGVDSSTQSTKVVLVDADTGAVLAEGRAPHRVTGVGGVRESDPEQWWSALRDALGQAGPLAAEVAAIAVGGQQHGLVTLDRTGRPVRPAILWNDVRAAGHATRLVEALGAAQWADRVGIVPVASITAAKWAWLRDREPESATATAAIRLPHDYLTGRLTGAAVTDRGDASGTGWYAASAGRYDPAILALPDLDLDPDRLPAVLPPAAKAGEVRQDAAAELGLRPGTVVAAGTGDNMAAALGLGLLPGEPVLSLGTSGTVYAVAERPAADPTGIVAGFADATGRYLPLACTLNCTQAVDRFAALLGLDREATEPGGDVVVLPFLDGERTPNLPSATGLVTGLRHDTSAGQILRAAYEGAAYVLLAALDQVTAQTAAPPSGALPPGALPPGGSAPDTLPPVTSPPGALPPGTRPPGASPPDTLPQGTPLPVTLPPGALLPGALPPGTPLPVTQPPGAPLLDSPLVLIGGGARGQAWRDTVRRLSGRPVQVPDADELVALGAAVQAAWCLTGTAPTEIVRAWGTRRGRTWDALPLDEPALARLGAALRRGGALLGTA